MKLTLVRYKTKPEAVQDNARLIEKVFQELSAKSPAGIRYVSLSLGDGNFVHFSAVENGEPNPIPKLAAFQTFQSGIKERCIEPPKVSEATVVGDYRMLGPR
jgi:radical SAM superfamily enzyme with C-terminal helix-hairpin-helix motif